ncbi:uncharacterized protein LOC126843893 [Adelges cooleyi]|uniref:uncharacterized protein LOC126843893 n=1 Tax=Adelges cooleyi TaxID=133065 RepID=UPI00217F339F|nr:uncharacterized protein LOC126843893 [Adelges cooleyi]
MNSIMRLRCVMLFAIFSFGLIISLHAASSSETSEADNEEVGDEDDDAIDEVLNSYSPMTSLRCRLTEPYLLNCLQKKETGEYEFHPFYSDVVEDAEKLIKAGKDGDASKKLITATQAMVVCEEVDCVDVLKDKEAVDSMWENWGEVTDQAKEGVLEKIKDVVEKFITAVKDENN